MTKEVLISIRGLQFEGAMDGEQIETITRGDYYKKNDMHYVVYEEVAEGFEEVTKNMIKFSEQELNITKRGLVNVDMNFQKEKKNVTNYHTPFGMIIVGIDTDKVLVREKEEKIEVEVAYSLDINYEHLADCKINMNITSKTI